MEDFNYHKRLKDIRKLISFEDDPIPINFAEPKRFLTDTHTFKENNGSMEDNIYRFARQQRFTNPIAGYFLEVTDGYITEGEIRTYPAHMMVRYITSLFGGPEYILIEPDRPDTGAGDVCFYVTYINTKKNYDALKTAMSLCGYSIGDNSVSDDSDDKQRRTQIYFPDFTKEVTKDVFNDIRPLYHVSLRRNRNKILKQGIVPKHKNLRYVYVSRTHVFSQECTLDDVKYLTTELDKFVSDKEPYKGYDGVYDIYEIDPMKLNPDKHRFFIDPSYNLGLYTFGVIPPISIKIADTFKI